MNTLATYAIFFVLGLFMPAWLAYTIAFLAGLAWVIFGSSRIVFKAQMSAAKLTIFAVWYLFVFFVGQLAIYVTAPKDPAGLALTSAIVLILTTPLTFFGGRYIFKPETPKSD